MDRSRLAGVLVAANIVSKEELAALAGAPGDTRIQESIARRLADHLGLPFVAIRSDSLDPSLGQLVPRSLAKKHALVPVERTDEGIILAMADPTDVVALDDVRARLGTRKVHPAVATFAAVASAQERLYAMDVAVGGLLGRLGVEDEADVLPEDVPGDFDDEKVLEQAARFGPVVVLVNALLSDAIYNRATDIHVEPRAKDVRVRQRVDGLLRESMTIPKHLQSVVISRLKIIAGMDITERRKAQDGRSKVAVEGTHVDARFSTIPAQHGEKVVIRLLHREEESVSLETLGMAPDQLEIVRETLDHPQGLIVFTGPTGAGKSSTMYAALAHANDDEVNIVSLEDPIEYQIEGVNQVQIDERSGVSFAEGLRSILRQDPDVVMVGEVRDLETGHLVVRAAATGHLVLSSLHTNDAASAVSRLVGLGIEPFRIASALSLVVAQRLVRVICPSCKEQVEPAEETLHLLGLTRQVLQDRPIMKGRGCEACGNTGFKGRTGVFEVLRPSQDLRHEISVSAAGLTGDSMAAHLVGGSLRENGLAKVWAGITTLEEILRVTYVQQDESPSCPSCRQDIDASFTMCPWCEVDLVGKRCGHCSKEVEAGWNACPWCRTKLKDTGDPDGRPKVLVAVADEWTARVDLAMSGGDVHVVRMGDISGVAALAVETAPDLILLSSDPAVAAEVAALRRAQATASTPVIIMRDRDDPPSQLVEGDGVLDLAPWTAGDIADQLEDALAARGLPWRREATVSFLRPAR